MDVGAGITLERALASRLNMAPIRDGGTTGVVLVADQSRVKPPVRFALEQAERYGANAVFLRHFPDGDVRLPLPQIYIYDRTWLDFSSREFGQIQRRLWNRGAVPLAAVLTATNVKVVNCRRHPLPGSTVGDFISEPFEKLDRLLEADQAFLANAVSAGTLWEDPRFADDFSVEHTAYQTLLRHLRHYKLQLTLEGQLSERTVKRLLVMAILVKYLDDRGDANNRVFPEGFFARFCGPGGDSLPALFRYRGACVKLFDYLSARFNGGIFALTALERHEFTSVDLTSLADFLEGVLEPDGQQVFWPLYSFEDLPVELISNIYEEFLAKEKTKEIEKASIEKSKGVVYTPPILVEFLLDQCIPLRPDSLELRILDPACGSGIFLVGAFRRLVQCWRVRHGWRKPGHQDLKHILKESIFGTDSEDEAVLVTAFSLCVALCDQLEPKVIWEELQLDDLRAENLQSRDFFEVVEEGAFESRFDVVIGNPPFLSRLTTQSAKNVERTEAGQRPKLPDRQLALLFMDQSFRVCRPDGTVCLIQPSGPLLYNQNALDFRSNLLSRYDFRTIFDFTPLKGILFRADVAAAAVVARNTAPSSNDILHAVFRRTRPSKNRLLFEIDYYDCHWLQRQYVMDNHFAWKADLLGGGRLHRFIGRFAEAPTLGEYLAERKAESGWMDGEGFNVGSGRSLNEPETLRQVTTLSDDEVNQRFDLNRSAKRAPHLTGKQCVPAKAVLFGQIDEGKCFVLKEVFFQHASTTKKEIFHPPHLLIREVIKGGRIPAAFSDQELVFSKQVYGIHAPVGQEELLQEIGTRLTGSSLSAALLIATSGRCLVSRDISFLASDLLALPFPNHSELELALWEEELIDDIVEPLLDFRQKGERSFAVRSTDDEDLTAFGRTYCRILNTVYKEFRALTPRKFGGFVCCAFSYGEAAKIEIPEGKEAEAMLEQLCRKRKGPRLFVNRIIRLYEENVILMIKPDQKRFWLRSIALRDADETMVELLEAGF